MTATRTTSNTHLLNTLAEMHCSCLSSLQGTSTMPDPNVLIGLQDVDILSKQTKVEHVEVKNQYNKDQKKK